MIVIFFFKVFGQVFISMNRNFRKSFTELEIGIHSSYLIIKPFTAKTFLDDYAIRLQSRCCLRSTNINEIGARLCNLPLIF